MHQKEIFKVFGDFLKKDAISSSGGLQISTRKLSKNESPESTDDEFVNCKFIN